MKKFFCILLTGIAIFTGIFFFLNINVNTQQGINYQSHTIKIPLYLKTLDFFDRHYNYKELVKRIVKDSKTDEDKVMRIFKWTHKNIRKVPEGFPIIDDHVLHIIIRGYGLFDQSSDVFTTLCNYTGVDAFFTWVSTRDKSERLALSFVKINKKWTIFDPYNGVYFKKQDGGFSGIDEIIKGDWSIETVGNVRSKVQYHEYFQNLSSLNYEELHKWSRANIQSPFNRLVYGIRKTIF